MLGTGISRGKIALGTFVTAGGSVANKVIRPCSIDKPYIIGSAVVEADGARVGIHLSTERLKVNEVRVGGVTTGKVRVVGLTCMNEGNVNMLGNGSPIVQSAALAKGVGNFYTINNSSVFCPLDLANSTDSKTINGATYPTNLKLYVDANGVFSLNSTPTANAAEVTNCKITSVELSNLVPLGQVSASTYDGTEFKYTAGIGAIQVTID